MLRDKEKIVSKNKKALHDYHIIDTYEAGIVLTGTEIKSARKGKLNLKGSYIEIKECEAILKDCHISEYEQGNRFNHEAKRERKLLLNKHEILKLASSVKEKGLSIVALDAHFNERNLLKLKIALVKGKKLYDKRESIKEKDNKRSAEREFSLKY